MYEKEILDLFKVMVVSENQKTATFDVASTTMAAVIDFVPNLTQLQALTEYSAPLNITTLFSVEERESGDIFHLIQKQVLHYIEVYGLDTPGLFNLEVPGGQIVTMNYIRGVTVDELGEMIRRLLYTNAPVKDTILLKNIIEHYNIPYVFDDVVNNELRMLLFNVITDRFTNGDDVVRYLCFVATGNALLIKSKRVLAAVTASMKPNAPAIPAIGANFFKAHLVPLAQVFNRHKRLILAAKNADNTTAINAISRASKKLHVPIRESLSKRFISEALNGRITDYAVLDKMSVRDKFKFLNLLEYKLEQKSLDAFLIRNGSVHVAEDRKIWDEANIRIVLSKVVASLQRDFDSLRGQSILLDPHVDYGLPVSRKQTLGQLPFGTTVSVTGTEISSGIYWENDWGASDLDLSGITLSGVRVGWGCMSGYSDYNIIFSGDVTDARSGAMEFLTSKQSCQKTFGLFVNIFRGDKTCKLNLMVGSKIKDKWIDSPVLREEVTITTGQCLGFVRAGRFVVYSPSVNGSRISGSKKDHALLQRGDAAFWTVKKLLDSLGISYDTIPEKEKQYSFDLRYAGFSLDKLEKMLIPE